MNKKLFNELQKSIKEAGAMQQQAKQNFNTQIEYEGIGSIKYLYDIVRQLLPDRKQNKVFLVTGKDSYSVCGAEIAISTLLKDYDVRRFSKFSTNPKFEEIQKGIDVFDEDFDIIIAIGGGSVIDFAKIIKHSHISWRFITEPKSLHLIAIPTTAGSGSESTSFATYYKNKEKKSRNEQWLLPNATILDPQLTMSLDKYQTACSGLDVLTQAIESYWSTASTWRSRRWACDAIRLSWKNLLKAVNDPDIETRQRMLRAANYAGKAINISKTTSCHAISYPLTSHFGVTHGQAVSLALSSMLLYNAAIQESDCNEPGGVVAVQQTIKHICQMLGYDDVISTAKHIDNLIQQIGLQTRLAEFGISNSDVDSIVEQAVSSNRMNNNPRRMTDSNLRDILMSIL